MEPKLLVLKLFLGVLGIPLDVSEVETRKTIQKAVYLGQVGGVDLGYRYGWYKLGPYCPQLADDYYELSRLVRIGGEEMQDQSLASSIVEKLRCTRALLEPPSGTITKNDWLELTASYHYLRSVRHKNSDEAAEILRQEKQRLCAFIDEARTALVARELIPG